ncbi:hypothetical protein SAMN04487897_13126 [Paenibacillus sp. yr247]|nr:hypothetical protein SAMN04487897_13126 [Paenibacillus sp. yr247]
MLARLRKPETLKSQINIFGNYIKQFIKENKDRKWKIKCISGKQSSLVGVY